jgi:hypothetical protein
MAEARNRGLKIKILEWNMLCMNQNASSIAICYQICLKYFVLSDQSEKKMLIQKYRCSKLYNVSGNYIANIVYWYNQNLTNDNI